MVHDFLKHNPSREQVERDRENHARRQAGFQARRTQGADVSTDGVTDRGTDRGTHRVTDGVTNGAPSRPVPTRPG